MSLSDQARSLLDTLREPNTAFAARYPGDRPHRQPVHTVYGGAHLFRADTTVRLGELARASMAAYGSDPLEFAKGVGILPESALRGVTAARMQRRFHEEPDELRLEQPQQWLACAVFERVQRKLAREPVEDFRIDFEDGFGARSDEEEDATAQQAATEVAQGMAQGTLPPFLGIRIKTFNEEWKQRGARTLEIFLATLLEHSGGTLPESFVVTLPKVTLPEQPVVLVRLFEMLEARHGLAAGSLRLELMIEVTQALMGLDGRSPLPGFLEASAGRCVAAHFGTYDFTASCNITAAYQAMDHPWCDLAKSQMVMAYAGTGVFLSDGATNVMPVGPHRGEALSAEQRRENQAVVHRAWQLAHGHIRHSLRGGFYQGWDLHPGQLPVRYAACFGFFLEGFAPAAERLRTFVEKAAQATLVGDVFDDAATGQGLLNYFLRALNCGAVDLADLEITGLTREEFSLRSFARILAARRERLRGAAGTEDP